MRTALLLALLPLLALSACGDDDGSQYTAPPSGFIAFTSERDGNEEIYVMTGAGHDPVNLTQDPANDEEPAWSPLGDRIAFVSNRGGQPDIYIMGAAGGDLTQITNDSSADATVAWSPDGGRFAFFSGRDQFKGFLWVMNTDGTDPVPVLESITPSTPEVACAGGVPGSWFPDGQTILYRGTQADISASQICSVKDDGSDIRAILSQEGINNGQPRLSPDGDNIVYTSDEPGNVEIYVMNADGSGRTRLTVDPGADVDPVWSPDGQWIAFASQRDGDMDIYIMRPDGSDVRQLTNEPGSDVRPSWRS
jgi:TolB protein